MKKLSMLGILAGAALLTATPLSSADAQIYGYGLYSGYGYPAYGYGGYYRSALGGYLGYRVARRVAINRARWR